MKQTFVAGDIQAMFNIDKTRYSYVLRQVGIKPETEVEGTGRSHQYSFKNVVQFGIADKALQFLSAKRTKQLLDYIEHNYSSIIPDFYDPSPSDVQIFYAQQIGTEAFVFYFETPQESGSQKDIDFDYWYESIKSTANEKVKDIRKKYGNKIFEVALLNIMVAKKPELAEKHGDAIEKLIHLQTNPKNISLEDRKKIKAFITDVSKHVGDSRSTMTEQSMEKLKSIPITESLSQLQHYMLNIGAIKNMILDAIPKI